MFVSVQVFCNRVFSNRLDRLGWLVRFFVTGIFLRGFLDVRLGLCTDRSGRFTLEVSFVSPGINYDQFIVFHLQ